MKVRIAARSHTDADRKNWLALPAMLGLLLGLLSGCALIDPDPTCVAPDNISRVKGGDDCLVISTYKSSETVSSPTLYVVLHGDTSRGGPSIYHYQTARLLAAEARSDVVAVAMIRPGYYDSLGRASSGNNYGRGDNATSENIAAIADAIRRLKSFYAARRVILIGHSGGSTVSGVILGRYPNLADGAVLVGCPCDYAARWAKRGMKRPPRSQSPLDFVSGIPPGTRVVAITGAEDTNTYPSLARTYVDALTARGLDARLVLIPGADHDAAFYAPDVTQAALDFGAAK
jgi:pimeloyl-ACP methyl ester carboxylesterase